MADETTTTEQTTEEMTAQDFITQLDDLKKNTVSRADYDKLKKDNQQLVNALINGSGAEIPGVTAPKEKPNLDELREKTFAKKSKNDLEYFTNLLALRDGVMADGQPDPFLPVNHEFRATAQDEADAERIATQIREVIDYANGDPSIFSTELQRRCGMTRRNNKNN